MDIVVCIKQVPDVPTIQIDRQRMTIIREGVESIINPLDYVALQVGLDLRKREGGRIIVITMGPAQSEKALREALAAGADHAILVTDPAFAGADTLATSHVLATAIAKLKPFPDLILCGLQTIDSDTGHVGPQIAEEMDLPQVCGVSEVHKEKKSLVVKRLSDGFVDTIRVNLPALLTVTKWGTSVNDLPLGAIETAFTDKPITRWGIREIDLTKHEVGLNGSATRVRKLRSPTPRKKGEVISGSTQILVNHLIRNLEKLNILEEEDGNE